MTHSISQQNLMSLLIQKQALRFESSSVINGKIVGGVKIREHNRPYLTNFQTLTAGKDLELIGQCFAEMIKNLGKPIEVIFTTSSAKGLYAATTVFALRKLGVQGSPSWATAETINCNLAGKRTLIIEDVMDDGGDAVSEAVSFLKKSKASLEGVVTLFDCRDQIEYGNPVTAVQRIRIEGVVVKSHLTALDLLKESKLWTSEKNKKTAQALQRYYQVWGSTDLVEAGKLARSPNGTSLTADQVELLKTLIERKGLQIKPRPLAEGRTCPYHLQPSVLNDGKSLAMIGRLFAEMLIRLGMKFDVICAADPQRSAFAVATMVHLVEKNNNPTFASCQIEFNQKFEAIGEKLEGDVKGKKVVVVEQETLLRGATVMHVIDVIKKKGGIPVLVLTPFHQQEKGFFPISLSGHQRISAEYCQDKLRIISLLTVDHFKLYLQKIGNTEAKSAIETYLAEWKEPDLSNPALSTP